jgi:hypothetical protein
MAVKIGADPVTLIHRAMAAVFTGQTADATAFATSWRLITNSNSTSKRNPKPPQLTNNNTHLSTTQPLFSDSYKLRKEQLRAMAWMETREDPSQNPFVEEEIVEANFLQLGYRLEGRATREITRPGGVLAFDVAFGKTALILALIQKKLLEAKAHAAKKLKGTIPLKATLIVVPNHLTDQWHGKVRKFLGDKFLKNTLLIKNIAGLKKLTIAQFQAADIIIVGLTLLDSVQYKASLANFAGVIEIDDTASARAKSTWRRKAVARVALNLERLRKNPSTFGVELKQQFQQDVKETEKNEVPVPSKRLSGQLYISRRGCQSSEADSNCDINSDLVAQSKRKNTTTAKRIRAKKRNGKTIQDDRDLSDDNSEDRSHVSTNKRKRGPTSQAEESSERDYFNSIRNLKKDWQNFKSPVLEMFSFNRLVIDEFTYFEGFGDIFESIQSKSRWILSGSPALGSFTDVKKMAHFLNVHLGMDDYDSMNRDALAIATKETTCESLTNELGYKY